MPSYTPADRSIVLPGASVTIAFFVFDRLPSTPLNLLILPLSKIVLTDFTFTENIFSIEDLTSNFVALFGTEKTILLYSDNNEDFSVTKGFKMTWYALFWLILISIFFLGLILIIIAPQRALKLHLL
jgi:hypothetical protein